MAWTQTDVDALKAAMARGEKSVTYGDKTVVYHSLQEQMALLKVMEADVALSTGTGSRSSRASFSRE